MKKLAAIVLCLVLLLTCYIGGQADEQLDRAVDKILKRYKTVGAAVLVAKNGQFVYEHYYGYARKGKRKQQVTKQTYFRVASVTKMVSAVGIMRLVEQGKLALDADLSQYLGFELRNPYYPDTLITLRQLMSHTSSISMRGGYSKSSARLDEMLNYAYKRRGNFFDYRPGSKYSYSNFGAGIMGSLMEAVTAKTVSDVMNEEVFEPLGIQGAYAACLVAEPEYLASLYDGQGNTAASYSYLLSKGTDATVNPNEHFRTTYGSLWIRAEDLCRVGMMLCQGGKSEGTTFLQEQTVAEMMADQKGLGSVTCASPYGLCVNRMTNLVEDQMIYGHQGLSNGLLCNLYFEPNSQFVFCFMSNGCDNRMSDRIAILSRAIFGCCWDAFANMN